jgi:hypothetical protein
MKALLLAAGFFLCSAAVAQQGAQPAPAPERKADAPAPRPLNLKLDESARSYVRETQPETKGADNLPTLGGGSLNFERQPRDMRPDARGKYPVDSENVNRQ